MNPYRASCTAVLFCFLLSSCAAAPAKESVPARPETSPSANEATQAAGSRPSPVLNGEPFELVVPCEETVAGSGNRDGFYQVIANEDGSHNAVFIDYKTCQQIYLCADANCRHNTDPCSSWFPADGTQIWPIACDDQIFFVHSSQESPSYIEKANPDGSNRQTLYELNPGATADTGAAYRSGYLVLMTDTLSMVEGSVGHTEQLIAIHTETGEATVLFEAAMPEGQASDTGSISAFFQGVTTNGFVVKVIETGASPDFQLHRVYEIPFDGSETHELLSFQTGEMQGLPNGDFWYYLKLEKPSQQLQLGYIDPKTNENHILVSDLERTIPVASLGDVFIRNFVDEWIILNAMTDISLDESQNIVLQYDCYAVNRNTGEIRELLLSNYYHATHVPIEILDEWEDQLLVQASVDEVAPQNPGEVMTGLEYTLALMNKEDYLSSNPVYNTIGRLDPA